MCVGGVGENSWVRMVSLVSPPNHETPMGNTSREHLKWGLRKGWKCPGDTSNKRGSQ